jgi:hypothetical protein
MVPQSAAQPGAGENKEEDTLLPAKLPLTSKYTIQPSDSHFLPKNP